VNPDRPAPTDAVETTGPRLSARGITLIRGGRRILDRVDFDAAPGEVVGVVGPSGSGKSSLLAVLGGLEAAHEGTLSVDGVPAAGPVSGTGFVLQSYALVGLLTAAENVEVALQSASPTPPAAEIRRRAADALAALDLADAGDHLVEEMSGGQQQRVALARALVVRPRLLLADEVTAELDVATARSVLTLVRRAADRGVSVVLATHDADIAAACDRIVRLDGGRRVEPAAS
jgi:ABC-type lipoprotein export system ATPase subunit